MYIFLVIVAALLLGFFLQLGPVVALSIATVSVSTPFAFLFYSEEGLAALLPTVALFVCASFFVGIWLGVGLRSLRTMTKRGAFHGRIFRKLDE